MLLLRKPSAEAVRRYLTAQQRLDFTYAPIGATATTPPAGYVVDHTRIRLGEGAAVFTSARAALENWQQFDLGWLEAWFPDTPIKSGAVVAVLARAVGLWWLNACRIVYVVDEPGPITRFGFAYGTLPDHAGSGEERFLLEWNAADNSVHYDILAFSRPRRFLFRLGYPVLRRKQKRFGRESAAAMLLAVTKRTFMA
ncbi:MAG: DUF1990 domain-containing protein [Planctomycetes bacterium]|nr:DUF1990 domain-containing protein [Planctomycetota bacterium]